MGVVYVTDLPSIPRPVLPAGIPFSFHLLEVSGKWGTCGNGREYALQGWSGVASPCNMISHFISSHDFCFVNVPFSVF